MRDVDTGHGISRTALTSAEIAQVRAGRLETFREQILFLDTFHRYRTVAVALADRPMDLETLCVELTRHSDVMYAAMIEALASLRAEGVRL